MKSDKTNLSLKKQLEALQLFITHAGLNPGKRSAYINQPHRDFTRSRKLRFNTTVVLVLGLLKKA